MSNRNKPYAAVICRTAANCGKQDIDEREYDRQMNKPNRGWLCPRCGGYADFDDARFEEIHGITAAPESVGVSPTLAAIAGGEVDYRTRITVQCEEVADELGLMAALDKVVTAYNGSNPVGIRTIDSPNICDPTEIARAVRWLQEKWG